MNDTDDPLNLDRLRRKPAPAKVQPENSTKQARFVQVPVSMLTALSTTAAPGNALLTWVYLKDKAWRHGGQPVKVTNEALAEYGIGRTAKVNALEALEGVGQIAVVWRDKNCPIVTVLGSSG
jgi:hypothetical protein